MTTYESFVLFKKRENVICKDNLGYDYIAKEQRESTLASELNGIVSKYFRISLSFPSKIELEYEEPVIEHFNTSVDTLNGHVPNDAFFNYDAPDIIIEAFDKDTLTNRLPKRIDFVVNPGSSLYDHLMKLGVIVIPKEYTNSNCDITLSKTLYSDGSIALTLNNVNLKDGETKLRIYYDDYTRKDIYGKLLNLYVSLESVLVYN